MSPIWHIYHIKKCRHARPAPKDKFIVIVCETESPMGFFINSDINPFIQKRPNLLACQADIEAPHHKCLRQNSYVDCVEIYSFEANELSDIRDPISEQAKLAIQKAVAKAKTLEKRYQKLVSSS
jgi:hypothetical protein